MTIKIAYNKLFSIEFPPMPFFQRKTSTLKKLENPSVVGRTRHAHYSSLIV